MLKSTLEDVIVLENRFLASDNYFMTVQSDNIRNGKVIPQIGQFYMLKLNNEATLLRRPISISHINFETGVIEFLYKKMGKGTVELSHLQPGQSLNIQGPLGHGFDLKDSYKDIVIVGAGIGLAPLKFLIEGLLANGNPLKRKITFIMGARDKSTLSLVDEFDLTHPELTCIVCTDDGSAGKKANVVTMLKEYAQNQPKIDVIYSCGPHIVLDLITDFANEHGYESQVSMEERMACGIGACVGCSVKTPHGMRKVCKDGPVMYSAELKATTAKELA